MLFVVGFDIDKDRKSGPAFPRIRLAGIERCKQVSLLALVKTDIQAQHFQCALEPGLAGARKTHLVRDVHSTSALEVQLVLLLHVRQLPLLVVR